MNLYLALFLSNQRTARGHVFHAGMIGNYPAYQLHIHNPQQEDYTLMVAHATYPHRAEGKGWGDAVYQESHRTETFATRQELQEFLTVLAIDTDDGWQPVESEEYL